MRDGIGRRGCSFAVRLARSGATIDRADRGSSLAEMVRGAMARNFATDSRKI